MSTLSIFRPTTFRSIQVMRGIACLLVLAFHVALQLDTYYGISWPRLLFSQGYAGVDLFFVISGFVIAYSSQSLLGRPTFFGRYWLKRLVRVYPLYWLVLILSIVGLILTAPDKVPTGTVPAVIEHWLAVALLIPGHEAVNAVSWSLSYELYFYALFSLLILNRQAWYGLIGVGSVTLIHVAGSPTHTETSFFFSPFVLEFYLGVVIWYVSARIEWSPWLAVGSLIAAIVIIVTWQSTVNNEDQLQRTIVFGTASGLLVFAGIVFEQNEQFRSPNWLCAVGDASYVLYLLHLPCLIIVNKWLIGQRPGQLSVLVLNGMTILLLMTASHYLHVHLEKPTMRRLLIRFAKPKSLCL